VTVTPSATAIDTESLRPSAHFTARNTWLNDPNGLLHHEGVFHLFFQNNPSGTTWGNISWGHATSTDLVTWIEHEVAIAATEDEMVFSGSAVVDHRNTAGFAGPGETAFVAIYTSATSPAQAATEGRGPQAQSLAYSVDDGMTWTRYAGNPVLDIGSSEFRDPKVFWHGGDDGHWVMVAVEAVERRVVVYTSPDLIAWERASHFGPAHATGGVWECPDLFPLPVRDSDEVRWVLVVSLNPGGIAGGSGSQYFIGDFDGRTFTADRIVESDDLADFDWLDYGRDYYAAVSFSGVADGRLLMIGWASNWQYANVVPTAPWRSAMSLVRELELVRGPDGRVRVAQRPVLPADVRDLLVFDATLPCGPGERVAVEVTSPAGDRFVVTVDGDDRSISCDRTGSGDVAFHTDFASVDSARLPAETDDTVDVRVIVDAMVVEVFAAGGLVTFTELVLPSEPYTEVVRVEG
jgi:sucrose-6-phosphate hydrolase SacC (GH32 family)